MKTITVGFLFAYFALTGCVSVPRAELAGGYFAGPVCGGANALRLELRSDGTYLMFARLGFSLDPWAQSDAGTWRVSWRDLILESKASSPQRYHIEGSGTALVWLPRVAYTPTFVKEEPNKALEPTPTSVTPPAVAGVAPAAGAAHL